MSLLDNKLSPTGSRVILPVAASPRLASSTLPFVNFITLSGFCQDFAIVFPDA
jgi:hypothetical protein